MNSRMSLITVSEFFEYSGFAVRFLVSVTSFFGYGDLVLWKRSSRGIQCFGQKLSGFFFPSAYRYFRRLLQSMHGEGGDFKLSDSFRTWKLFLMS